MAMTQRSICHSTKNLFFRPHSHQVTRFQDVLQTTCLSQKFRTFSRRNGQQSERITLFIKYLNEKLNELALTFSKQCNALVALRVRRAMQVKSLYQRLGYDSWSIKKAVERFGNTFLSRKQPLSLLFAASLFSWKENGISEQELNDCVSEIQQLKGSSCAALPREQNSIGTEWEKVIDRENLVLWRKPRGNGYLYEYKVFGTYKDVAARDFYMIQTDLDYRKQWDKLVIQLEVIDKDEESGSEVVKWITHYPYPMYSREYIYVRKCVVDQDKKVMVLMSRGIEHPTCPVNKDYVRVFDYKSHMVIKPHTSFDENGFDYILSYYDDPQASIPSPAYKWMAATGVPDFCDKLALIAKQRCKKRNKVEQEEVGEKDQLVM